MTIDPRSGLTEPQVALLRGELLEFREELAGRMRARTGAPAEPHTGAEPRGDAADQAVQSFDQALAAELVETDRRRLRDIEDALARFESGTYGICEATGEPIGFERLSVEPWARYTREHEAQLEAAAGPGSPWM